MAERFWILNLHRIDSMHFHRSDDINSAVKSAFRAHCVSGRIPFVGYDEIDPEFLNRHPQFVPAAAEARRRGFQPVFVKMSAFHEKDWLAEVHIHSPRHHRAIINRRMSFAQMIDAAERWHESKRRAAAKLRDRAIARDSVGAPTVLDLDGEWIGWRWVWLRSDDARDAEGQAMGNCVGGGGYDDLGEGAGVFSLRDPRGEPHVTAEIESLSLRHAECRGGAAVSDRFRPLIDRMAAVIGVRMCIHGDPTRPVADGVHVVNSVASGDTTTYYVDDGVLHRSGGPARLSEGGGVYYERGVEMRRICVCSDRREPLYYACRMIDDLSERLGDDRYYSVGDRYRLETPVNIVGEIIDHRWSGRRNAAATAARIRRVPPAVNANIQETRP